MSATSLVRHALGNARSVVARQSLVFVLLAAIAAAPGMLGVLLLDERDRHVTVLVSSLLNLYLQLFATSRALDLLGAMPPDYRRAAATEGRYASAFFAGFLSTLAIGAGLVLLVVPGLVLLALWGVWMPALAAERLGSVEALRRSWRLARPRLGSMLLLVLLVAAVYAVALILSVMPVLAWDRAGATASGVLGETLLAGAMIASAVIWAGAYRALTVEPEAG